MVTPLLLSPRTRASRQMVEMTLAKLVQAVRNATVQFSNVNAATAAGYQPLFSCVSGPDQGAMGMMGNEEWGMG